MGIRWATRPRDYAVAAVLCLAIVALFVARLRFAPLKPTTVWLLSGSDGVLSLKCRTLRGTMILESDAGRVGLDGTRMRVELPAIAGGGPASVVLGKGAEVSVVGGVVIGGRTYLAGDRLMATANNELVREPPMRALRPFVRGIEFALRRRSPIEGMIRCSTVRPKEPNMPAQQLTEFVFRERQAAVSNDSFSRHAWKTMTRAMTTTDLWTMLAKSPLPSGVSTQSPLERFIGTPLARQLADARAPHTWTPRTKPCLGRRS